MPRTAKYIVCVFALVLCVGLLLTGSVPQVATGTWASGGAMSQARAGASAALLQDGRILITGGDGGAGPSATAEFYGTDGSFLAAAPMNVARSGHISAVLKDGRVLVAGGICGFRKF